MKVRLCQCQQCKLSRREDRRRSWVKACVSAKRTADRMRVRYALKNLIQPLPALLTGYTDLRLKPTCSV